MKLSDVPVLPDHINPVPQTAQLLFTVGQVVPILIFCYLAYRYTKAYKSLIPWTFLVGGGLMCMIEPLVDHNGLVWFPIVGQWTAFTDYGVHLPIWLVMAYVWFFGGRAMYIWHAIEQGAAQNPRWMFKHWGVVFLIDAALENVGLYLGLFLYYGHQPLQIGKFPLWWGAINSATPIVLATAVVLLRPFLQGKRVLLVIPLAPAIAGGVNAGVGWITWNAMNNTNVPVVLVWVAGCVTITMALAVVHIARSMLVQAAKMGVVSIDGSHSPEVPALRRSRQRVTSPAAVSPASVRG
jgi:hypothetical protein